MKLALLLDKVINEELRTLWSCCFECFKTKHFKMTCSGTKTVAAAAPPHPLSLQQLILTYECTVYQPTTGLGKKYLNC